MPVLADAYEVYFGSPEPQDFRSRLEEARKSGGDVKGVLEEAVKAEEDLTRANLSGADLRGANLSGAYFRLADLSGASLSWANLSGADLLDANLSGAALRWTDLSGAALSSANLSGADLWQADLSGAYLTRAHLSGANLSWADLSGATLTQANLSGATLTQANLSGADLTLADLSGAILREARMYAGPDGRPTNLEDADLRGARMAGMTVGPETILDGAKLARCPLGEPEHCIYDELLASQNKEDATYGACADIYRQLKRSFQDSGNYAVAGEFFVREMHCTMRAAFRERRQYLKGLGLWVMGKLCAYGENPLLVLVWVFALIVFFGLLHSWFGVTGKAGEVGPWRFRWGEWAGAGQWLSDLPLALYFSTVTFTTLGYGDLHPISAAGRLCSGMEALMGMVLMSLFLVCIVRKFSR